jgi:hypothetical protein
VSIGSSFDLNSSKYSILQHSTITATPEDSKYSLGAPYDGATVEVVGGQTADIYKVGGDSAAARQANAQALKDALKQQIANSHGDASVMMAVDGGNTSVSVGAVRGDATAVGSLARAEVGGTDCSAEANTEHPSMARSTEHVFSEIFTPITGGDYKTSAYASAEGNNSHASAQGIAANTDAEAYVSGRYSSATASSPDFGSKVNADVKGDFLTQTVSKEQT